MNLISFLVELAFLSLVYFRNSKALENPNDFKTLPTIEVERRSSSVTPTRIYIYSKSASYDQLSGFPPLRFEGESTIFLKNEDFGGYWSSGRLEVNLRLTCEAPYITKWVFNSHFEDEAEREKRMLPFNYSVKAFSRLNESPFSDHRSEDVQLYNLTELTIHSVGNSFKSASLDCVSVLNESIKSSFNIFQRFADQPRSLDIITSMQTVASTFVVPCRVNDPDVIPQLQRSVDNRFLDSTFVKYHWKSGFRRVKDESFSAQLVFLCTYGSSATRYYYQKYNFEQRQEKILIQQFKKGLNLKINQETRDRPEVDTFTVEATLGNQQDNSLSGLNSIQITECTSPHYCVSDIKTEARCTNLQICIAPLPPHPEGQKVNRISTEGKVVTYGQINKVLYPKARVSDTYFTGLSGKMYLASQPVPPKELIEVNIELTPDSKNIIVSCRAVKFLTFDPIRFSKTRGGTKSPLDDEYGLGTSTDQRGSEPDFLRRKSSSVEIMDVCDVQSFSCHALWFNSTQWMEDTAHLNQQEFAIQKAVRDKCTVTGRPATRPANRPTKPIPGVSTTTPGSTKDEVPPGANNIVYIASLSVVVFVLLLIIICCVHCFFTIECLCCGNAKENEGKSDSLEMKVLDPFKVAGKLAVAVKLSKGDISVEYVPLVGEGEFSKVWKGTLKQADGKRKPVVVKINKIAKDATQLTALVNDLQTRVILGENHPNMVALLGVCLNRNDGKVMIVMDLEDAVTIRDLLTNKRLSPSHENVLKMPVQKRLQTLTKLCKGVAYGMEYLHGQKVVHGNLAAENVLVLPSSEVKITGFSHAHQLEGDSKYFTKPRKWTSSWETSGWKWMPSESLRYMEFSRETDVWSFGVVMWEIFSMGALPYIRDGGKYKTFSMEFVQKLEFGIRLPTPELASKNIYQMMEKCWSRYGKDRPYFTELSGFFKDGLDQESSNTYIMCQR